MMRNQLRLRACLTSYTRLTSIALFCDVKHSASFSFNYFIEFLMPFKAMFFKYLSAFLLSSVLGKLVIISGNAATLVFFLCGVRKLIRNWKFLFVSNFKACHSETLFWALELIFLLNSLIVTSVTHEWSHPKYNWLMFYINCRQFDIELRNN